MAQYRIGLGLGEALPIELDRRMLTFEGHEVVVTARRGRRAMLEIEPIEASDREEAHMCARRALNNLLNYLEATIQFPGFLRPGYEYENLEDPTERGQVVVAEPAVAYLSAAELPDGFSIDRDLRAAAYLRRGDCSSDAFDSFRNYYLAVDAVGKCLRTGGQDSTVILDTIGKVASAEVLLHLDERLRASVKCSVPASAPSAETLNCELYKGFRCALMHSGSSSDFTPFDPADEALVQSVLPVMRRVAWQYVKYERVCPTETTIPS